MLEKIRKIEELILDGVKTLLETNKELTKDDYIVMSNIVYNFKNLEISLLNLDLEKARIEKEKEMYSRLYDGMTTMARNPSMCHDSSQMNLPKED